MNTEQHHQGEENILKGHVVNISALLTYHAGAVVSRTIMKTDKGTVTLFAFDAGDGLSEHTTPFDALVLCLEGEGEVTIAGKKFEVSSGDMLIMPKGEPHAVRATSRFKMLLVMLRA